MDLGDRFLSTTFYTKFTTVNASGAPTTLGNSPTLQFYVGAGATAFTVGLSLDVDFNSVVGLNHVTVIATTSATGFATAVDIQVVVATGSVSGVSLKGYKVCEFSLQNRAGLRPVTQGRNLVVDANGLADANMVKMGPTGSGTAQTARDIGTSVLLSSGTGTGQIVLSSGKVVTPDDQKVDVNTLKTQALTVGAAVTILASVGTAATSTAQTGDSYALANGASGFVAIKGDTAAILVDTGTTLDAAVAAIKMQTDKFVFTVANQVDSNVITKTGFALTSAYDFAKGTTAMTEAYAANGAAPTPVQAMFAIHQMLMDYAIVTTALTVRKLNNVDTAFVVTLDDATTPTSAVRV